MSFKTNDTVTIHQASDLIHLFQAVHHDFVVCEDKESDLWGQPVLVTTIELGEVTDAGGGVYTGTFSTTASAAPIPPLDNDESVEPTPINRVYLMTRNFNALVKQVAETFVSLNVIQVGGVKIEFATTEGE